MTKVKMPVPLVEIDGDEMTRIIWKMIKDFLLEPYIDLNTEYYDLGLTERDATEDRVTIEAAEAIKKYGVGVKCATITPNAQRVEEYDLKKMWKSPNGTIREMLDGTVFRAPILVKGITPSVRTWTQPIIIARHAFGDIYNAQECVVDGEGTAELVVTRKDGSVERRVIADFDAAGGVVENSEGEVLMIRRKGWCDLPKGHIEQGETPREAAAREIEEETGLHEVDIVEPLCTTNHFHHAYGRWEIKRTAWFTAFAAGDNPELLPEADEQITSAEWLRGRRLWNSVAESYTPSRSL